MQNDDQTKRKRKRNPNTNAICTVAKQKSRTAAICHSREKGMQSSLEYKVKNMYRKKWVWALKVWKMRIRVWLVSKLGLYAEDYTVLVKRNAENNSIFCQPIHRMLIGFFPSLSIATKQAKKKRFISICYLCVRVVWISVVWIRTVACNRILVHIASKHSSWVEIETIKRFSIIESGN